MAAACWIVALVLGLVAFALQELGWYDLSARFFAYMVLGAVGFAVSWVCLAVLNVRELARRNRQDEGAQP